MKRIFEWLPVRERLGLCLVSSDLQAVVKANLPLKQLLITLGQPRGWVSDDRPDVRAAELTAYHRLRGPRQAQHIDQLRLSRLDLLTDELLQQMARLPLHSLWLHHLSAMLYDPGLQLDLGRLAPLASVERLRLGVAVHNAGAVQLAHVRRLHLSRRLPSYTMVNFLHWFPSLERLTCDILMLMCGLDCRRRDGCRSAVRQLRLLDAGDLFPMAEIARHCWMLPALWRLRLELASFEGIRSLDAFADLPERWRRWLEEQKREANGQLPRLEFTSTDLLRPGLAQLPDLRDAVEHLQRMLPLDEMVVTLWGFHLRQVERQTELLYDHLRARHSQRAAEEKIFDW